MLSLALLLCLKYMHFAFEVRVGSIERDISIPKMTITKNTAFFAAFLAIDIFYAHYLYTFGDSSTNIQYLMINEYIVLSISLTYNMAKLLIHYVDYVKSYTFHSKVTFFSHLFILKCILETITHMVFLTLTILRHGILPILFVRPLLASMSGFVNSVKTQLNCNKVVSYINRICPDSTPEDLSKAHDITCVVCREEMTECKRLPCGHMFHLQCLKAWFQRQQTCPTCRLDILSMINNLKANGDRPQEAALQHQHPQTPRSIYDERFEECQCIQCRFFEKGEPVTGVPPDPRELLCALNSEHLKKVDPVTVDRDLLANIRLNLEAAMAQTALLEERLKTLENESHVSTS